MARRRQQPMLMFESFFAGRLEEFSLAARCFLKLYQLAEEAGGDEVQLLESEEATLLLACALRDMPVDYIAPLCLVLSVLGA